MSLLALVSKVTSVFYVVFSPPIICQLHTEDPSEEALHDGRGTRWKEPGPLAGEITLNNLLMHNEL